MSHVLAIGCPDCKGTMAFCAIGPDYYESIGEQIEMAANEGYALREIPDLPLPEYA